jgi:hypothetical protein
MMRARSSVCGGSKSKVFSVMSLSVGLEFELALFARSVKSPTNPTFPSAYHLSQFLISLISVPLLSRYLERVWGTAELLKFSAIVVVASNIIGFGLTWIMWFVLGQDDIL